MSKYKPEIVLNRKKWHTDLECVATLLNLRDFGISTYAIQYSKRNEATCDANANLFHVVKIIVVAVAFFFLVEFRFLVCLFISFACAYHRVWTVNFSTPNICMRFQQIYEHLWFLIVNIARLAIWYGVFFF